VDRDIKLSQVTTLERLCRTPINLCGTLMRSPLQKIAYTHFVGVRKRRVVKNKIMSLYNKSVALIRSTNNTGVFIFFAQKVILILHGHVLLNPNGQKKLSEIYSDKDKLLHSLELIPIRYYSFTEFLW